MANKLISEIGLPKSIANVFAARNISTAKDALSRTELELMEFLDVGLAEVRSALAHISEAVSPPHQTALSLMEQRSQDEHLAGHLPTGLRGLDAALCGGIPFGVVTELVGPPGIGKTQFCLKLCLLAALPTSYGGLNGRVVYIDVESKFGPKRMIEIGVRSFPDVFQEREMAREMAGRIYVVRPTSLAEFTQSLQEIKVSVLQNQVKMLIVDSIAALVPRNFWGCINAWITVKFGGPGTLQHPDYLHPTSTHWHIYWPKSDMTKLFISDLFRFLVRAASTIITSFLILSP